MHFLGNTHNIFLVITISLKLLKLHSYIKLKFCVENKKNLFFPFASFLISSENLKKNNNNLKSISICKKVIIINLTMLFHYNIKWWRRRKQKGKISGENVWKTLESRVKDWLRWKSPKKQQILWMCLQDFRLKHY